MEQITWVDKDNTLPTSDVRKQWRVVDILELKTKFNDNVDEVEDAITAAETHAGLTNNPHSVTKTQVGLSNVDNTSDAGKPVSTAQQTALNLKANLASPTFTGTVAGITKSMVGLGNVDNTADTAKPVSTAQQTAIDAKVADNLTASTTVAPSKTAVNTALALRLLISNLVWNEVPTGTINGSNLVFTVANTPISALVVADGAVLSPTTDYTLTGTTLTFIGIAPVSQVLIFYLK